MLPGSCLFLCGSVSAAEKRRKAEETQQSGVASNGQSFQSNGGPSVSFLQYFFFARDFLPKFVFGLFIYEGNALLLNTVIFFPLTFG